MIGLCLSISPSFSVTVGGVCTAPCPPRSQGDGVAFPASTSSTQAPPGPEGKASRSHRGQGRTAWDPDCLGSITVPTQATGQPHICRDRMEPAGWEVPLQEAVGKECSLPLPGSLSPRLLLSRAPKRIRGVYTWERDLSPHPSQLRPRLKPAVAGQGALFVGMRVVPGVQHVCSPFNSENTPWRCFLFLLRWGN